MPRLRFVPVVVVLFLAAVPAAAGETAEDWIRWGRRRAADLERWGEYENACDEWRNVARLSPSDVEPLARAAVLAVDLSALRGKDLDPASTDFKIADACVASAMTRGGQGDPSLAYAIGRMRCAEGRWGSAWKMLGEAKQRGFDPVRVRYWYYRASVNRAAELVDVGRAEEAVKALDALLKENPGHPDERHARFLLAGAHRGMQEPDVARKMLEDMLKAEPGEPNYHYLLALILTDQGRLEEAETHLRQAMSLASGAKEGQTFRNALLKLCDLQLKSDKIPEAEESALRLQELAKDDAEVLYRLGRVRQAQDRLEEAVKLFRRVARLQPQDLETLINLQQTLDRVGEKEEAAEVGRRITEIRRRRSGEADGGPSPR